MMNIHREGRIIVIVFAVVALGLIGLTGWLAGTGSILFIVVTSLLLLFFIFMTRFFRKADRKILPDDRIVYAPADGRVVAIEETEEKEYFKERRIQISVFMTIWDVHINWFPVGGKVVYYKYHPGKYFVAKLPKSSELNERNTIVVEIDGGPEILFRQIAGAVARRIISYAREGRSFRQGEEVGFIRFGSRVDVFLPPDAKVGVKPGEKVYGKRSILATL